MVLQNPFNEIDDEDPLSHHVVCVMYIAHFRGEHAITPAKHCPVCSSHIATKIFNQQVAIAANNYNLDHKGQQMHDHFVGPDKKKSLVVLTDPVVVPQCTLVSHNSSQIHSSVPRVLSDVPTEQLHTRLEQLQSDIAQLHTSLDAISPSDGAHSFSNEIMSSQQAVMHYCTTLLSNPVSCSNDSISSLHQPGPTTHFHLSVVLGQDRVASPAESPMSSQQAVDQHFDNLQSIASVPQPTDNG